MLGFFCVEADGRSAGGRRGTWCPVAWSAGRFDRALGPPMLPLWRTAIGSRFLRSRIRTRIGPRPVVVLRSLVSLGTADLPGRIRPLLDLPVRLPVSGRCSDFEFVQLVPLFIGAIPLRDCREFANPTTRINRFWIIHADIMDHSAVLIQYSRKMRRADNLKTID